MKKILLSVLTLGIVAVVAVYATNAFFSDKESSMGNTIIAGSIDISVDEQNPWDITAIQDEITDMKPSYVRWTRHVVRNVGTNPVKLWKHIKDVDTENNGWSEPECSEQGGRWVESQECESPQTNWNGIDKYIEYDMYIDGNVVGGNANSGNNWFGGHNDGGQVVISEEAGLTIHDIQSWFIFLGYLEAGDSIIVWQSYHMRDDTGNWAQTDKLTYTIEFYGEQVNGNGPESRIPGGQGEQALLLENKDDNWDPIFDDRWAVLKWAGDGPTFDFNATLEAYGLNPDTHYALIYYADPWPGDHPGMVLATGQSNNNGYLSLNNNIDLGYDLPNPSDANYSTGAKLWLVPTSDYDESNHKLDAWNPSEYLFEYTLMTYDDTDV